MELTKDYIIFTMRNYSKQTKNSGIKTILSRWVLLLQDGKISEVIEQSQKYKWHSELLFRTWCRAWREWLSKLPKQQQSPMADLFQQPRNFTMFQ